MKILSYTASEAIKDQVLYHWLEGPQGSWRGQPQALTAGVSGATLMARWLHLEPLTLLCKVGIGTEALDGCPEQA